MRRLALAYEAAAAHDHGPRIALGAGPNTRREIGLFAFAVAARRHGMDTDYLGADLPIDDWLGVVDDPALAAAVITALHDHLPELVVAVGGAQQSHALEPAVRLSHDIAAGAKTLAALISQQQH